MLLLRIIFLMILIVSPYTLFSNELTLENLRTLLINSHPVFRKGILSEKIILSEQKILTGDEDWQLSSSFYLRHEQPALNFSGPENMTSVATNIHVNRNFWSNGGNLEASFQSGYYSFKIDPFYNIPSPLFGTQFSISYSLPILRNKNGFLYKLQYDLKKYDIDYSKVIADENCEDFLTSAITIFLNWAYLDEQLKIARQRLQLSNDELNRVKKIKSAGLVDNVDVIRADNAVTNVKQHIALLESQWKAVQAELSVLTDDKAILNATPSFDLYSMVNIKQDFITQQNLIMNSRLIKPVTIKINKLILAQKGLNEQEKPDLSTYATLMMERINSNVLKSYLVNKPTTEVGIKLSLPLENRAVKHNIEKNILQIRQLEETKLEIKRKLSSSIANLTIQISNLENILQLNRNQIESAKKKTKEEKQLYDRGRGDLTFVIQSRDDEEQARLIYTQNAYHYHCLVIQYRSLLDELYTNDNNNNKK